MSFDVAVIGGGPAGMMAAGRAGELGAKVVLIEKNKNLGRKLLLTGKGRCNLAKAEFNHKEFVKGFGKQGQFLLSALSVFGIKETIEFFEKRGLKTKIERGKRVFPKSDKARDVLNVLVNYLREGKVAVLLDSRVTNFEVANQKIIRAFIKGGRQIKAKKYILCSGGKSYPQTGSTGDGFRWAEKLGHSVTKLRPALVPLKIKERWVKQVQGLALKNVKITFFENKKKRASKFGEALFTHFGLSGPIILEMSKKIGQLLDEKPSYSLKLFLDLKPGLDFQKLDKRVQRDFEKYRNKMFKNSLADLLPQKLIPVIVRLSGINPGKKVNKITKEERQKLVKLLKNLEMTVVGLLGFDKAIITNGGISLKEIDSKTMKSKIIDNLYFAGEIIDLDGPSGGYNLQLCWTTGFVAGQNAAGK